MAAEWVLFISSYRGFMKMISTANKTALRMMFLLRLPTFSITLGDEWSDGREICASNIM
jgi:hypothetical protein